MRASNIYSGKSTSTLIEWTHENVFFGQLSKQKIKFRWQAINIRFFLRKMIQYSFFYAAVPYENCVWDLLEYIEQKRIFFKKIFMSFNLNNIIKSLENPHGKKACLFFFANEWSNKKIDLFNSPYATSTFMSVADNWERSGTENIVDNWDAFALSTRQTLCCHFPKSSWNTSHCDGIGNAKTDIVRNRSVSAQTECLLLSGTGCNSLRDGAQRCTTANGNLQLSQCPLLITAISQQAKTHYWVCLDDKRD